MSREVMSAAVPTPLRAPRRRNRVLAWVAPKGVGVRHFIIVPALAMAAFLWLSRLVDHVAIPYVLEWGMPDLYSTVRGVVIGSLMAVVIAFLAIDYRSGYEEQLRGRNETLERTRDFLSRIIESSAEAIITRDEQGRVTSWNPAAEEIYGWSAAEMLGERVDRLIPGDDARAEFDDLLRRVAGGETINDFETTRVRRDGKPITVRLTLTPLTDGRGRFAGTSAFVRDVTALKEMEALLLERERLAAVGELAAMVAHEVRNPLAGIRGGCEILLEGYPEGDPRNEIGQEVIRQVDRLNRTVHDLLTFARPRASDPVPTDLNALIERVVGILAEDPSHRDVLVERDYDPGLPIVAVDGRQMEQVLINLILNAAQAMGERGTITVATRATAASIEASVRDRGSGIPPDKLDQIFKPFFTTRAQGTGLGLAIVKKIVEAHGGVIRAESAEGGGAVFTIDIPREV